MKLRPRLDALEAKRKPDDPGLVIVSTSEEAAAIDKPATIIVTGVPRPSKDPSP